MKPDAPGARRKRTAVRRLAASVAERASEAPSSPFSRLWPMSRFSAAPSPGSESPLRKRKRLEILDESETEMTLRRTMGAEGEIEIMEVDAKGEFVKVRNKGAADVTMSG